MNPAFLIIVLLAAVAVWFLSSFIFPSLGKLLSRIWEDMIDAINK